MKNEKIVNTHYQNIQVQESFTGISSLHPQNLLRTQNVDGADNLTQPSINQFPSDPLHQGHNVDTLAIDFDSSPFSLVDDKNK